MIIINEVEIWAVLFALASVGAGMGGFQPATERGLNFFPNESPSDFLLPEGLAVNVTNDSITINATGSRPFEIVYLNGEGPVTDYATALTIVTGGENITAQLGQPLYRNRYPVLDLAFVKGASGGYKYEIILARPGIRIRQTAEYRTFFDGNDTKAWLIAYQKEDGRVISFIGPSLVSINVFTEAAYTYERQQ